MSQPRTTVLHDGGSQPPDQHVASSVSNTWAQTLAWQVTARPAADFLVCHVETARATASPQGVPAGVELSLFLGHMPGFATVTTLHLQGPSPPPGTDAIFLISKQGPDPPWEPPNPV